MAEIGTDLEKAAYLLRSGHLVAIPTETVYGLAANALSADAVSRIFKTKNRPKFDPLIVHFANPEVIERYVLQMSEQAKSLAKAFWPGPLTLILEKQSIIPDLVTAGLSTVGVRCPNHPITVDLLKRLDFPLAAPSANPFGYVSPTTPKHVQEQLGDHIPYILDGGPCSIGVESTIVGWEDRRLVIYRPGGISSEAIERITGEHVWQKPSPTVVKAPGQMKSHYATKKKIIVGNISQLLQSLPPGDTAGVLSFSDDYHVQHQSILSPSRDLGEATRNLFAALRTLDAGPVTVILTEKFPEEGLGRAINDRLKRASSH